MFNVDLVIWLSVVYLLNFIAVAKERCFFNH